MGNLGRNLYFDLPARHRNYDLNLRELPGQKRPERTNYGQKTRAIAEDRLRQTIAKRGPLILREVRTTRGTPEFAACGQELGIIRQKQADCDRRTAQGLLWTVLTRPEMTTAQ